MTHKNQSYDLDVLVIGVKDPFLVQCAGHNYRHNSMRYRTAPVPDLPHPYELPSDPDQCSDIYVVEEEEKPVQVRCQLKVYKGEGSVHGFLCKEHHDKLTIEMKKASLMKLWERTGIDLKDLLPTLYDEVEGARLASPVLDYRNYVMWGWTREDDLIEGNHRGPS